MRVRRLLIEWAKTLKEQKLIVVGDRQMAVFEDVEEKEKLLLYPHSIDWKNHVPIPNRAQAQPIAFDWEEPLRAGCRHFLDCIQTRRTPRTDGQEALRVLTVLHACQQRLERGTNGAAPKPSPPARPPDRSLPRTGSGVRGRLYFAHGSAFIDEGVEIGEGTTLWHVTHVLKGSRIGRNCRIGQNVVIGPNVTIGDHVKIQNNVSVYEGVTLEDHVCCGPSMVFANVFKPRSEIGRMEEFRPTRVRRGASLGANCTIVRGVTIGQYALIGAGAVVLRDVPDYALDLCFWVNFWQPALVRARRG